MTEPVAEIGRNKFDEWCWRRGLTLEPVAEAIGCSIETVRKIRLPFSDDNRRVPGKELAERIVRFTAGAVTPADFYPSHLLRGAGEDRADA